MCCRFSFPEWIEPLVVSSKAKRLPSWEDDSISFMVEAFPRWSCQCCCTPVTGSADSDTVLGLLNHPAVVSPVISVVVKYDLVRWSCCGVDIGWLVMTMARTLVMISAVKRRHSRMIGSHLALCAFLPPFITLIPRQNGRRVADDIFKRIFSNEHVRISVAISLKFVPKCPINNIPALVQIMAWRRPGDKPLSEPMLTRFTDAYMQH